MRHLPPTRVRTMVSSVTKSTLRFLNLPRVRLIEVTQAASAWTLTDRRDTVRVVTEAKIPELDENAEFSHCRAVALAAAMLPNPRLAAALERLLGKPGLRGHSLTDLDSIRARASGDPNETGDRNRSLREIYLAMGLFLPGDPKRTGRDILEA